MGLFYYLNTRNESLTNVNKFIFSSGLLSWLIPGRYVQCPDIIKRIEVTKCCDGYERNNERKCVGKFFKHHFIYNFSHKNRVRSVHIYFEI